MRFKTFLEDTSSRNKTRNKPALALFAGFEKNFQTVIDKQILLYRAALVSGGKSIYFEFEENDVKMKVTKVTGRVEPRESKAGDNTLMYASTGWKEYPSRLFSTFATQQLKHAAKFGPPQLVIPADNVKNFGWMPEDFNQSPKGSKLYGDKTLLDTLTQKIRIFVGCVGDLFRAERDKGTDFRNRVMDIAIDNNVYDELLKTVYRPQITPDKLKNLIAFCDRMLKKHKELKPLAGHDFHGVMDALYAVMEFLEDRGLSSVQEGFELVNPKTYGAINYHSFAQTPPQEEHIATEIWFEGDYLLINFDHDLASTTPAMQIEILQVIKDLM